MKYAGCVSSRGGRSTIRRMGSEALMDAMESAKTAVGGAFSNGSMRCGKVETFSQPFGVDPLVHMRL